MNKKMTLKIVTASVVTGLVLVSSLPMSYAHEQSMQTVSCHPDKHMTAQRSQAGTGSDVVGFGEYDPAQSSAAGEEGTMPGNVTPGVPVAHVGFAEVDPAGSVMMDDPDMKGHQMTHKMAGSSTGHLTAPHDMAEDCMKMVASAGETGS